MKAWLEDQDKGVIFCFVQFKGVQVGELPRVYLATPLEVAERLDASAKGRGDTILYENHQWGTKAHGAGTIDRIPRGWKFSKARVEQLLDQY